MDVVINKWTKAHTLKIEHLRQYLTQANKSYALQLLERIVTKSEKSETYRNRVIGWLDGEASYRDIRDMCAPFGKSFSDIVLMNKISVLESARQYLWKKVSHMRGRSKVP